MTKHDDAKISGSQRLRIRNRHNLIAYTIGALIVILLASWSGYIGELIDTAAFGPWLAASAWIAGIALFVLLGVRYYRRADELIILDNIWAGAAAFLAYATLFPSWLLFYDLGLSGEPDRVIIYIVVMTVAVLAYGARKLGWR